MMKLNNKANIKVIGVGSAGSTVVAKMAKEDAELADFAVVSDYYIEPKFDSVSTYIKFGKKDNYGLRPGGDPGFGRERALEPETVEEIHNFLNNCKAVFLLSGMGGETGTGATPVFAAMAKERGRFTVAVVTEPFVFEGKKRAKNAASGIKELEDCVDILIIIHLQKFLDTCIEDKEGETLKTIFEKADGAIRQTTVDIINIISKSDLDDLDFAGIKTILLDKEYITSEIWLPKIWLLR